jgi:ABC-type hemin transport system ATPase subunit
MEMSRVFRKIAAPGMGTLRSLRNGLLRYNGGKSNSWQVCEQAPVDCSLLSQSTASFSFRVSALAKCIIAVGNRALHCVTARRWHVHGAFMSERPN